MDQGAGKRLTPQRGLLGLLEPVRVNYIILTKIIQPPRTRHMISFVVGASPSNAYAITVNTTVLTQKPTVLAVQSLPKAMYPCRVASINKYVTGMPKIHRSSLLSSIRFDSRGPQLISQDMT